MSTQGAASSNPITVAHHTHPPQSKSAEKLEGYLGHYDVTLLDPRADSHSSREWWCKVAAYAEYALIGIIVLTGFVLTAVYTPAFIPTVSILIIGCLIGADKLHNMFMGWAGNYAQKQKEDAYVENRLKDWIGKSFSDILDMNLDFITNSLNTTPEEILKNISNTQHSRKTHSREILFARLHYQYYWFEASEAELEKNSTNISRKEDDILARSEKINMAIRKGQVISTEAQRDQNAINSDLTNLRLSEDVISELMARAMIACALYTYLIKNTVKPYASALTLASIFQSPIPSDQDLRHTGLNNRPYVRLLFNKRLTIAEIIKSTPNKLADIIHTEVTSHLAAAENSTRSAANRA